MGASESLANEFEVVEKFNGFIMSAKGGHQLMKGFSNILNDLKNAAENFFAIYEQLTDNDKLGGEGIDINLFFSKILIAIEAFGECVHYIDTKAKKDEIPTIKINFRNDLRLFILQVTQIVSTATSILQNLYSKVSPSLMTLFYIELSLFDFSLNIRKSDKPPFYTIFSALSYELHDKIYQCSKRFINIVAPHGSGKTNILPILIACRSLQKFPLGRFIILVEHDSSSIRRIKNIYRRICSTDKDQIAKAEDRLHNYDKAEDEAYEYDIDDPTIHVTSTLKDFLNFYSTPPPFYPIIGIFSPIDALRLLHTVKNPIEFVTKSTFVIDDIHMRTVATDVFIQDLIRTIEKAKAPKDDLRLTVMSTVSDMPILRFIGRHQDLTVSKSNPEVSKTQITCKSIADIRNNRLFLEMHRFFDTWRDGEVLLGSVIAFVPSEKVGQRLYKEIFKFYSKDNSTMVCPLTTTIRKNEKPDEFYNRLFADMTFAESERPKDSKILFLMPMNVTGMISKEERALIHSQVPLPFINKLSRVFITTMKNESLLRVNDLMAIFDTGLEEVEFYDPYQCSVHVREQQLPKPFMEEHRKMLGDSGDGLYIEFKIKNKERPESLIPSVKRIDLGKELLLLRNFGIKLEDQLNLPNECNHEVLDECFSLLKRIGIINNNSDKELTEIGKVAAKFSSVSPFFALATAKFTANHVFAFLCSLLIEYMRTLVVDPQSKLLCKHFCRDSDVVTLIEAILEMSESTEVELDDNGLSIGTVYAIYNAISTTFDNCDGRQAVIDAVKWARKQAGGTFQMVDNFVKLIPMKEFLKKREGRFMCVLGAGPGSEPTLVYKADDIFKFEGDEFARIKFVRRPGWLGLQSPGEIFVLSLLVEEESKLNRGLVIHRNTSAGLDKPGVVSFEVNNPSLNSFFFVSLFEAYWSDRNTINDFVGIYHTPKPKKESAFLIHMTNNNEKIYLNYCPRNTAIENAMRAAIPLLSSLMPFVPRSLIAKVDVPICAVEVLGYGTSQHYSTNVLLITESDSDIPIPYPINRSTLQYAQGHLNELKKTLPLIRFAVTAESFYYKSIRGREVEADLSYPNASPSITSVFDPCHSSHLVLLVDRHFPAKPPSHPLVWLPAAKRAPEIVITDTEDNNDMVNVASKIMTSMGYAEKSADLFFVTLSGGVPRVARGDVPEVIMGHVGYNAKDKTIKQGVYSLVKHFVNEFTRKQKLEEPITLTELSSTNDWKEFPKDERQRETLCDQISNGLKHNFGVGEVQCTFIGQSMLAIRIDGLREEIVCHRINSEVWDDVYKPCTADNNILNVLNGIKNPKLQVTTITHEPTVTVCVRHMRRFDVSEDEFTSRVQNAAQKFGFLTSAISEYMRGATDLESERMGVLGDIQVELIGIASGIAFASIIVDEFPTKSGDEDNFLTSTMATCLGMATINPFLGPAPTVGLNQRVVKVSPSEIDALKQQIASKVQGQRRRKWNLDTNFNVLIIPASEEAALNEMMRNVRNKDEDTTCLFLCEPPQQFLPQSLYVYQADGSVRTFAVCKQCIIEAMRGMEDLQYALDPITHMVDRKKLSTLTETLPGFPLIDDGTENDGVFFPQIPLGQAVWTLMSEPDILGTTVKSWFTVVIDFIVRMARNYFTYCPNHPDMPHRVPKAGASLKCPMCNFLYCASCRTWHSMDRCPGMNDLKGVKRCPNCHTPTYKYDGCNHITCRCGKHWCYKCDISPIFNNAHDCYSHLTAAHGGYFT